MTTGKTIALIRQTFVGKVISLLFNMLSRLVITLLPGSKHLLISWLQLPSAVILEPKIIKSDTSTVSPSICHEVMGPDAMILVFWMLSFKPTFSLSSFTFIKRLFSSSSLSAIRVVSSAYLKVASHKRPHIVFVVQSLSRVWLFVTPWTAAHKAFLSFTIFQSLLKLMSIESVIPSNHLVLCHPFSSCPQSLPASGSFPVSQLFTSRGQRIGASASPSVLPMKIHGWLSFRLTGWISLQSKGLSRVFSSTSEKSGLLLLCNVVSCRIPLWTLHHT